MTVLALLILGAACEKRTASSTPQRSAAAAPPVVYTTFYPGTYFTQRIVGDLAEVVCPVPPGADPAAWEPTREQIGAYQKADVIVINGARFEGWIKTAALPESRIITMATPIAPSFITYETITHSHGPSGAHTHQGVDGHTWVDPMNARAQAEEVVKELSERWPAHASALRTNFTALDNDLAGLHAAMAAISAKLRAGVLLSSHPAYNYLSRRYELGVVNIAMEPGEPLDDAAVAAITRALAARPDAKVRLMLWEDDPHAPTARMLEEKWGIRSVVFSPCESISAEQKTAGTDFVKMMHANIERLAAALGG